MERMLEFVQRLAAEDSKGEMAKKVGGDMWTSLLQYLGGCVVFDLVCVTVRLSMPRAGFEAAVEHGARQVHDAGAVAGCTAFAPQHSQGLLRAGARAPDRGPNAHLFAGRCMH
jgi:hypothetical protein